MPINEQIKANKVQVIDEQGEKRGVMGIHDALDLAYEKKLDLVLVAPNAEIPVCKINQQRNHGGRHEKQNHILHQFYLDKLRCVFVSDMLWFDLSQHNWSCKRL